MQSIKNSSIGQLKQLFQNNEQKKQYQVQVTIIEARNLISKSVDGSDPFVKITVGNLPPQVTDMKSNANTVVFNQSFTFKDLRLSNTEFENQEILIQVFDQNPFRANELVGQQSIGISTLYKSNNHEFFKVWLPLINPEFGIAPRGSLLISCYIIGVNDRPPVHDINEYNEDNEVVYFGNIPDEQLTQEQLQLKQNIKKGIIPLPKPEINNDKLQLLVSIVRGEDLPILQYSSCDSFISCRVGSNVLITSVVKNSQKPNYQTRMVFPIYFPAFNDKIVMRVWDKRKLVADTFISCIPEKESEGDWFSITSLHSRGGTMPFKWFHLYGIPLNERPGNFDQMIAGKVKQIEGSSYFGRVLLSLSLSANDNTRSEVQPLAVYKEPPLVKFVLRADTYELQSQFDCGDFIIIEISLGGKTIRSYPCQRKNSKKEKTDNKKATKEQIKIINQFEWKEQKIQSKDDLQVDLTADPEQHPDIILSLYSTQVVKKQVQKDKEQRLAYLRIKPNSPDLENEYPKWYSLRPVKYQAFSEIHSHILLNLQLQTEQIAKQKPRHNIKRNIKVQYIFKAFLYGAYDLCPKEFAENVECEVYLQLGAYQKPIVKGKKGKNVIWNIRLQEEIQLDEKLEFSSNIILSFNNLQAKGVLGTNYLVDKSIGQCTIRVSNCEIKLNKNNEIDPQDILPEYQFYHIMKNGTSNGRILGCFQLIRKEQQTMKFLSEPLGKILEDSEFNLTQISFPIIGIRNLPVSLKDPVLCFRIAQPDLKFCLLKEQRQEKKQKKEYYYEKIIDIVENQVQIEDENDAANRLSNKFYKNPNFCILVKNEISEPVKIPIDVRFLPQLEIEVREKSPSNNVRYTSVINLIEYIPWVTNKFYYSNVMEYFDIGRATFQIMGQEDDLFLQRKTKEFNNKQVIQEENQQDIIFDENFENQVEKFVKGDGKENEQQKDDNEKQKDENEKKQKEIVETNKEINIKANQTLNKSISSIASEINNQENQNKLNNSISMRSTISKASKMSNQQNTIDIFGSIQKFKNAEFFSVVEFYKDAKDEDFYKREREDQIEKIKNDIRALDNTTIQGRQQIQLLLRQLEAVKNQEVKENAFLEKDDEFNDDNYDYGRDIQRQPMVDVLEKSLPYKKFQIYQIGEFASAQIGVPTNAYLKAHLKIQLLTQEQVNQEKTIRRTQKKSADNSTISNKSKISQQSSQRSTMSKNQCLMKYAIEDDDKNYPFNIFNQAFLQFFKEPYSLKIRVYILRCLNLSAQSQKLQAYHLLAGMNAVCSASSYPKIQVGTGKDETGRSDIIKLIIDDQNVQENTLNPSFFKMYELDAILPEDWNLIITIMNKGQVMDSLIGEYEVDLEDRIFGITELRKNVAYEVYRYYYTEQLEKIKYNYESKMMNKKRLYEQKITELSNLIESFNRDLKIPVEYIELKHPQENTCQGTMELFIEPFPIEVARIIPQSNIQKPSPQEFEIRLVVWEVFSVKLPEGKKAVNMYVSVSLDSNANIEGKEVVKQTDNHCGSENGNGVYNYRMKFPLCIPCLFPRLRIQVFDFSTIGTDENLGETVITLKNAIKKLQINGSFDLASSKYLLEHPKDQGEYRGEIQLSMKIISKQQAESNPVGEAQDAPNEDPFLEKPKEGRGISAFLKGSMSFSFSGFFSRFMVYGFIIGIIFIVIVTILILFYKPGILVK